MLAFCFLFRKQDALFDIICQVLICTFQIKGENVTRKRTSFRQVTKFGEALASSLGHFGITTRDFFGQLDQEQVKKLIKLSEDHQYLAAIDREDGLTLFQLVVEAACKIYQQKGWALPYEGNTAGVERRLSELFDVAQTEAKNRDLYRMIGERLVELSRGTPEGILSSLEYNRTMFEFCRPYVRARMSCEIIPAD
ncbi:MAG: hypothetical protein Q7S03_03730 [bacterium]|nr:hypothetical protein [bacterium]